MPDLVNPFNLQDLKVSPSLAGKYPLTDVWQKAVAILLGQSSSDYYALNCLPCGILLVASPVLADVFHITATSDDYTYSGEDIPCSEVMIWGHFSNTGLVWVRRDSDATTDNAIPLGAEDYVKITLTNLSQLRLLIATSGDKAIVAYCR